jgi:hypothetical protein
VVVPDAFGRAVNTHPVTSSVYSLAVEIGDAEGTSHGCVVEEG